MARRLLQVLKSGDREEMLKLALSGEEFERFVFPQLPASRPHTNITAEWLYNRTRLQSLGGLQHVMGRHGGRDYDLLSIRFAGGSKQYPAFTIHKDARLRIRDDIGNEREIDVFGSVIEMDGEFKIYSFKIDD